MQAMVAPGRGYIGCNEVCAVLAEVPNAKLNELSSLPLAGFGQRLLALRYFLVNGSTWLRYFAWEPALTRTLPEGPTRLRALQSKLEAGQASLADEAAL